MKKTHHKQSSRFHYQKGIHFILFAVFLTLFISLAGLLVGIGFIANDTQRVRNAANLAAIAAIDAYERQASAMPTPQTLQRSRTERASDALNAAKEVLQEVRLNSGEAHFENISTGGQTNDPAASGTLDFGQYYQDSSSLPTSCHGVAPCFVPVSPSSATFEPIYAARVRLSSPSSSSFIAPFTKAAKFLTNGKFNIASESIAVAPGRCTAVLLDVSSLSFKDKHFSATEKNPTQINTRLDTDGVAPTQILYPLEPAIFALRGEVSDGLPASIAASGSFCNSQNEDFGATSNPLYPLNLSRIYWCNLGDTRSVPETGKTHYRSDYRYIHTRIGNYLVDLYTRPEPMKQFLDALNGAMQDYGRFINSRDRLMAFVFDDMQSTATSTGFVDRLPEYGSPKNYYDSTGYLAQLFNIDNIGTVNTSWGAPSPATVYPNMMSRGWIPRHGGTGSNLPLALRKVMGEMNDTCGVGMKKNILVATTGAFRYGYNDSGGVVKLDPYCTGMGCSAATPGTYSNFESQRLFAPSNPSAASVYQSGIVGDAQKWGISISVLFGGARVQPNICNVTGSSGSFLDLTAALFNGKSLNLSGTCGGSSTNAIDTSSNFPGNPLFDPTFPDACYAITDYDNRMTSCAYKFLSDTSIQSFVPNNLMFRRAGAVMARLAIETKGKFCPILPLASSGYVNQPSPLSTFSPQILDPSQRTSGTAQTVATERLTPGAIGAQCIRDALGVSPVYLATP